MYRDIVWEQTENVVVITLNRPRVLNALNRALKGELGDALTRIKDDPEIRAVILTGAGDQAFSAGQDLTETKDMSGPEAEEWVREYELLYDRVRMLDVPVIAAVNGWAMGAGCQLALLADIRISSENARYGMPEIRDGIPAVFGLELLWNTIGMSRGLYLVLSGESLDARQAQEAGFDGQGRPAETAPDRGHRARTDDGGVRADRDETEQTVRAPEDRGGFPSLRQVLRERAPRVVRCRRRQAWHGSIPREAALTPPGRAQGCRVHSFKSLSSISTPSPGRSRARISPCAYCTGRRATSPARSNGPNSSQPHVTGAAASATWR